MARKFNTFNLLVIGVMLSALLRMPSNTVSAAGKPPTKTPTATPITTPTATPASGVPGGMADEWHANSQPFQPTVPDFRGQLVRLRNAR